MEANQKRLYEHFLKLSESYAHKSDPLETMDVRKRSKENVKLILKAYPHFEKKEEVKKETSKKSSASK